MTDKLVANEIELNFNRDHACPVGEVYAGGMLTVNVDLYEIIKDHLATSVEVLNVRFDCSDKEDILLLYDHQPVISRGRKMPRAGICVVCKKINYFAMGKPFFCISEPVDKVNLSDLSHVILPNELLPEIRKLKLSGVKLEKMSNLKKPQDGLPFDLYGHFASQNGEGSSPTKL